MSRIFQTPLDKHNERVCADQYQVIHKFTRKVEMPDFHEFDFEFWFRRILEHRVEFKTKHGDYRFATTKWGVPLPYQYMDVHQYDPLKSYDNTFVCLCFKNGLWVHKVNDIVYPSSLVGRTPRQGSTNDKTQAYKIPRGHWVRLGPAPHDIRWKDG